MVYMATKNKISVFDILLIITVLFSTTGLLFARAEKTGLNKVIEGKENIAIEILIPDVNSGSLDNKNEIFKVGEKAAITIRNRPYTKLDIIQSESKPKLLIVPDFHGSFKTPLDPTRTNTKDYTVTLTDTALKTADGYVIGGNKIKIGNQIELEGFNYRLTGKVINLYPIKK